MNPMQEMCVHAAAGRLALQHCTTCGNTQYPPRELCAGCLADSLEWRVTDDAGGEVLASTVLHHSHEPAFRSRLPLRVGLVRLDTGPTAVCFLAEGCDVGSRVRITARLNGEGRAVLSGAIGASSFAAITQEES